MLFHAAIIFSIALAFYWLFLKMRLPGILGLLLAGALLGPQLYSVITDSAMIYASELRLAALIVILIRAGLGISKKTLNEVGISAMLLGIFPALFEGLAVTLAAWAMFDFSVSEAGMLGFILAAVSPAIVVPQMIELSEQGYGANKHIPTLILAGASLDDVIAITMFGIFASLASGDVSLAGQLIHVPLSIITALIIGGGLGWILAKLFSRFQIIPMRMAILFMILAIFLTELEHSHLLPIASLLGVLAMGFIILEINKKVAEQLSKVYANIWIAAEIILFVALGAAIDLKAATSPDNIIIGLSVLAIGLSVRGITVIACLTISGNFTPKERLFCAISYLPKATVQAAMGAIPLSMGMPMGGTILSIAVLSILITAPLGAIAIRSAAPRLLVKTP